jgi:hypothetical protein
MRQAFDDMRKRKEELQYSSSSGGGSGKHLDMTHAPVFHDMDSKNKINTAVNEIVRGMLTHTAEEMLTGQAIYNGVLRHPRLMQFRDERSQLHADAKTNEEKAQIIERLAAAIATLKKRSMNLAQCHAYQSILTAIAPDGDDETFDSRKYTPPCPSGAKFIGMLLRRQQHAGRQSIWMILMPSGSNRARPSTGE